jgi:hypothetical protein
MKRIINFRFIPITIYPGACSILLPSELLARLFCKVTLEPAVTTARQEGKSASAGALGVPHPDALAEAAPPDSPHPGITGINRIRAAEGLAPLPDPSAAAEDPKNACGPATDHQVTKPSQAEVRREQIIHSMCMTRRHDYGIPVHDEMRWKFPGIAFGMTQEDRKALFNEMAQLYEHHIAPVLKREKDLRDQCNDSLSQAVEQTMVQKRQIEKLAGDLKDPSRIHKYMGKRLDYWLELEAQAELSRSTRLTDAFEVNAVMRHMLKQITGRLGIKDDSPLGIIMDTIQSYKQHAERYRTHNRTLANGDRLISQDEYERLLAIERGHQAANTSAESCHARLKNITDVLELPEGKDTRAVVKMIYSMKEQLGLIRAALKRAGIDETTPEHVSVTDLATRYNKTVDDYHKAWGKFVDEQRDHNATALDCARKLERMGNDLAATRQALIATGCNDLFCTEVNSTCHQCPAGNRRAEQTERPFYGPNPLALALPALKALARIAKQVGFDITGDTTPLQMVDAICDQIQSTYQANKNAHNNNVDLGERLNTREAKIQELQQKIETIARHHEQTIQAFEDSEAGRVEAIRKVKDLVSIVDRKAPHTKDCCPVPLQPCNCWKLEFRARAFEA